MFVLMMTLLSLSHCGESKSEIVLTSIKISPNTLELKVGQSKTLSMVGVYSDGQSKDVADIANWTVSKNGFATVSKGVVTGVLSGEVTILASIGNLSARSTVTIEAGALESLSIEPANPSVANGLSTQLEVLGHYEDGSTQNMTGEVTWSSSDELVATVSNAQGSKGLASGEALGTVTIQATYQSLSASVTLTVTDAELVSIDISPASPTMAVNTDQQFVAMGTFTDASVQDVTDEVTWESTDEAIASVSNFGGTEGVVSALSNGTTTISATYDEGITDNVLLTVSSANLLSIAVTPNNPSLALGLKQTFTATGTFDDASTQDLTLSVTWASSDLGVATVSNASPTIGTATSEAQGTTTISATLGLISGNTLLTVGAPNLVSIAVTPVSTSIRNGTLAQFKATGSYTNNSTQDITDDVTWSSSDLGVATISNGGGSEGLATSVSPGTATIVATLGLISGNTSLTVQSATLTSIAITPNDPSIADGTSVRLTATGTFSDASTQDLTKQVTWASSDVGVATISSTSPTIGVATSVSQGSTTISATLGLISDDTNLTVTPATIVSIEVTPDNASIFKGNHRQYTAMGTFTDASVQDISADVVWGTSDISVVDISNADGEEGLAEGVDQGTATLTATLGMVSDVVNVTVDAPELVSIEIDPADVTINVGDQQQYTVMGMYSDTTVQDLTNQVTWSSSDTGVATISNSGGTEGLATSLDVGETTISATFGLLSDDTTLTTEIGLDYVTITPTTSTLKKNKRRKLKGRAYYTDGSSVDVTNDVTRWTSSNNAIIKVNQGGSAGKVRAYASSGTSTITFTYTENGVTRSTTLDITAIP